MQIKESLMNNVRYRKVKGVNISGDRYNNRPSYIRDVRKPVFNPDDPRNLSLKLIYDADEGKPLELLDIEVPPPVKPVERIKKETKRQLTPSELRELSLKIIPEKGVVARLDENERVLFEREQEISKGVIMNSLFEENIAKGPA